MTALLGRLGTLLAALLLAACAAEKPKPTPLEPLESKLNARAPAPRAET